MKHFSSFYLEDTWREKERMWGDPLHRLCPYIGKFPPALANYFITRLSDFGDVVADPFAGSGTVPLEAVLLGRRGFGSDTFTLAQVISRAKLTTLSFDSFKRFAVKFSARAQNFDEVKLDNPDVEEYFHPETLAELLKWRALLLSEEENRFTVLLRALICAVLHGPSAGFLSWPMKETYSSTVGYIKKYKKKHKVIPRPRSVLQCVLIKARTVLPHHSPTRMFRGKIFSEDSRQIVFGESLDLVVTSPPYLRVLDYTWNNWLRLWFLGVERKTERKRQTLTSNIKKWESFMGTTLENLHSQVKPGAYIVIVTGDVRRGSKIYPSALRVARIAEQCGKFEPCCVITDDYDTFSRPYQQFNMSKYTDFEHSEASVPRDRCLILRETSQESSFCWKEGVRHVPKIVQSRLF